MFRKGVLLDIFNPERKDFLKSNIEVSIGEKIALITGATRGIGKAVGFTLGKAGYTIMLNGI